ncbi:UNKNOWN [Stylonychia lemnae]|uniref:Uncharacterized protein n=1 Tax=Stylonychia lemnae TaxID=5949 RepID=A0A078AB95_STYLE|nr:UNKNOWN [Stylonychia lemnae]|eukprot:CDW79565.1 UNKNOWN [Stylonychia lemnae]
MGQKVSICTSNLPKNRDQGLYEDNTYNSADEINSQQSTKPRKGVKPMPNPNKRFAQADMKPKGLMGKFQGGRIGKKVAKSFKEDNNQDSTGLDTQSIFWSTKRLAASLWRLSETHRLLEKSKSYENQDNLELRWKGGIHYRIIYELGVHDQDAKELDGKVRFAPDQPSTVDKNDRIINLIQIDKYMIQRAEQERDNKVKNMMDCLATENSWCLSENFERDCKERGQMKIDDDINFDLDIVTHSDDERFRPEPCNACEVSQNVQNKWDQQVSPKFKRQTTNIVSQQTIGQKENNPRQQTTQLSRNFSIYLGIEPEKKCAQKFIKFCPSSSYIGKETLNEISQVSALTALLVILCLSHLIVAEQKFDDTCMDNSCSHIVDKDTVTYLKVIQEEAFNVWTGFLEGFYDRDPHLKRAKCMGDTQLYLMEQILLRSESFQRETFFFAVAGVISDVIKMIINVRSNCKVDMFLQDLIGYCEDHCEGHQVIQRLSKNFNKLSKIYQEIMKLMHDSNPENIIEQFKICVQVGGKIGELFRLAIGFSMSDQEQK